MAHRSWIFIRGLTRGQGHWGDFPEQFKKHFPEDEIELLDLPGNGERYQEASPLQLAQYVLKMRSQSSFISSGRQIHVLAVSLGAMVTVRWMEMFPQDFARAFLVCTSAANFSQAFERLRPANYRSILKLLATRGSWLDFERHVLPMILNNPQRIQKYLKKFAAYSEEHPMARANFFRQIAAATQARFPLKPPGNLQLLGSYGDQLVSPQCTLAIAEAWSVKPQMHPSAGHDIPVDDPDWVLKQLA